MTIERITRYTRRCANSLVLLLGIVAGGAFLGAAAVNGLTKQAAAVSFKKNSIKQQKDEMIRKLEEKRQRRIAYIKTFPKHQQAKYYRLNGTQKPGHECFFTGKEYHVVWNSRCQYNHAFDWESVSMFGEFSKQYDAVKTVDGRLDTKMNSKETRKADGIVWWELNLAKAVKAGKFVIVQAYGLQGGVLAVSQTVRGDKLMTDKSGKVKRFYLAKGAGSFKVDLDGKPVRHFRLYTHTAEWRRVKKVPTERLVTWVNNSPFYSFYEVYILD
jgi:hypothetical protein